MSIEQLVALHDHERRVRRRVCTDNLVLQADGYWKSAYAWLQQTRGSRLSQSDLALAEARRIVEDDGHFISMKIQGALESQLRHRAVGCVGSVEQAEDVHERALPAARGAHNRDELPRRNSKIDAF